jgi:hypothetical protein
VALAVDATTWLPDEEAAGSNPATPTSSEATSHDGAAAFSNSTSVSLVRMTPACSLWHDHAPEPGEPFDTSPHRNHTPVR